MPVPEIFQVRYLETDELFDVGTRDAHSLEERARGGHGRMAVAALGTRSSDRREAIRYARVFWNLVGTFPPAPHNTPCLTFCYFPINFSKLDGIGVYGFGP